MAGAPTASLHAAPAATAVQALSVGPAVAAAVPASPAAGGKRKADEDGQSGAASKKANTQEPKDKEDPSLNFIDRSIVVAVLDEAAEAKAMSSNFKYVGACVHRCSDVPFLQYDKDGPRRSGPLVQHLEALLARHTSQVDSIENLAIDLLSLACEQVCLWAPGADCWLFSGSSLASCAAVHVAAALQVCVASI